MLLFNFPCCITTIESDAHDILTYLDTNTKSASKFSYLYLFTLCDAVIWTDLVLIYDLFLSQKHTWKPHKSSSNRINSQINVVGEFRRRKTNGMHNTLAEVIYNGNIIYFIRCVCVQQIYFRTEYQPKRCQPDIFDSFLICRSVTFITGHVLASVFFCSDKGIFLAIASGNIFFSLPIDNNRRALIR